MTDIVYVKGDATQPMGEGVRILPHVCNDVGGWGRGYVVALSRRWPQPEASYRQWHVNGVTPTDKEIADEFGKVQPFALGGVQFVSVDYSMTPRVVANMIAQRDVKAAEDDTPPIRYDALRECLRKVAAYAVKRNASVHMPRIGAGLAGGDWAVIESIIRETLCAADIPVTVYDLV
jgi:O-acetyl-ADP-ribose deacetylase (regulator of RNase III)